MNRRMPVHRRVLVSLAVAIPGSTSLLAGDVASNSGIPRLAPPAHVPVRGATPHVVRELNTSARSPAAELPPAAHPSATAALSGAAGPSTTAALSGAAGPSTTARLSGAAGPSTTADPSPAASRAADTSHSAALFAGHSWYVAPPPPPPVAPAPPPPPTAPPFPYSFVGSYAPAGAGPVYFLSRSDRVIDAHVGDRLDGVYEFESAGPGGLVFNYLPLNIRQTVATGDSP